MVLNWFLSLPPLLAITLISALISFVVTIIYKFAVNQSLMKSLKEEIKELQKLMKDAKNDPKRMLEIQKISMEKNMVYFKHSMRSTFFSLIPVLLIFTWMSSHYSFSPILPNEQFNLSFSLKEAYNNNKYSVSIDKSNLNEFEIISKDSLDFNNLSAIFTLKAKSEGTHNIKYEILDDNKKVVFNSTMPLIISKIQKYTEPKQTFKEGVLNKIEISNKPLSIDFKIFSLSWFWAYFILSLFTSTLIRKLLNVY